MSDPSKQGGEQPTEPPPAYSQQSVPPQAQYAPPPPVAQPGAQPGYSQQPPPGYGQQPPPAPQPGQQPAYGQPPPQGYAQPQPATYGGQQQMSTVVIAQPRNTAGFGGTLGPSPVSMTCPGCNANIVTSTNRSCGAGVWMWAGIICLIGCAVPFLWLGCFLIPFCIPSLYDSTHSCPNCRRQLGHYKGGGL